METNEYDDMIEFYIEQMFLEQLNFFDNNSCEIKERIDFDE